ncbi:MAG: hypothetical protein WD689_10405 [Gaiellaceae bacterium]
MGWLDKLLGRGKKSGEDKMGGSSADQQGMGSQQSGGMGGDQSGTQQGSGTDEGSEREGM